ALRHVGELQQLLDLLFLGAVEHRSRHGYTLGEVLSELQHFIVGERGNFLRPGAGAGVVDLLDEAAYLGDLALLLEHGVDLLAQALGGEAEVGFENLANVHPRRHAEGVQHDVHGDAIDVVGHVLHRLDGGDHTLVAVATGHLVTGLDAALDRQVDLDGLEYAEGEVVVALQLALLVLVALVLLLAALLEQFLGTGQLVVEGIVFHAHLEPLVLVEVGDHLGGQHIALLETGRLDHLLAHQGIPQALEGGVFHDAEFVLEVLAVFLEGGLFDLLGTGVLLQALAGEHLYADDGALGAARHPQGSVLHVGGLLAEDGPQQFLLGGQLGLALGGDLAHQDIAGGHFRAHVDDAGLVEAGQRRLTHVGDIGGDLLGAEFGVPRGTGQFLDMNGGETVFLHHPLGDEDGVLEVVAVPGHEGDAHVLAECQFAEIDGGAIGEDIALGHHIAALDDGALVDAGVLVGPGVLDEVVDVDTGVAGLDL